MTRNRVVAAAGAVLAAGLAAWLLWPSRAKDGSSAPKPESREVPEQGYTPRQEQDEPPPPAGPSRAGPRPDAGPTARMVYVPGKGWAKVVQDPNAVPPPPKDALPEAKEKPELPPMLPQTAAWKLKMNRRLRDTMERSVERLEKRIQEAKASGASPEEVHKLEILLQRRRMRLQRIESDIRILEKQAEAERAARQAKPAPKQGAEQQQPEPTQQPPGERPQQGSDEQGRSSQDEGNEPPPAEAP